MDHLESGAVKYEIPISENHESLTDSSQMPTRKKRPRKQNEVTAASKQRKMDPAAFKNLTLDEASDRDGGVRVDYSNPQARRVPDLYRPCDVARASSDSWRPRDLVDSERDSRRPDVGREADYPSQPAQTGSRSRRDRRGVPHASLPQPNRTGIIRSQESERYDRKHQEEPLIENSFASINNIPSAWRPDPKTPSYVPWPVSPLGSHQPSITPSASDFTAYQPVRSVRNFHKIPPWRVDKYYRFAHNAAAHSDTAHREDPLQTSRGRRNRSPPRWKARYPLRPNNNKRLELRDQTPRQSTVSEDSDYPSSRNSVQPPPLPLPTTQYLQQARSEPRKSDSARPLLLVVDLNGTLVERKKGSSNFVGRPNVTPFLKYVLDNHTMLIWSSASPQNVMKVCQRLFSKKDRQKVIGEWGRDTLDLTPEQFKEKVQVYKKLDKIWRNETIKYTHPNAEKGEIWDQTNTILIDDSRTKAAAQPHNLLEIPEFKNKAEQKKTDVLKQVAGYLEELRWQVDVSAFIRTRSFRIDDGWSRPWPEKEVKEHS